MIAFLAFTLAGLAAYLLNDFLLPYVGISTRAMLGLIVFIAVYMLTSRYLKQLRD